MMRKMSTSDCSALPRLLTLLHDASHLSNVAEPTPGFTPAVTATSFLLDLIKRNRAVCSTRQQCERIVTAVSRHTAQPVSLATREYITRSGRHAKVYGLTIEHMTLWWLYGASEPRDRVDLSVTFSDDPPLTLALATPCQAAEDPVEPVLGDTYLASLRALPEKQRRWILMQHDAMFRAIDRPELFAQFREAMDA